MISAICITIIILYLILIGSFSYCFDQVEDFVLSDRPAKTMFTVIIPFRNEADNLPELLKSLIGLNYPHSLFDVLLVDDQSEDNSVNVIKAFLYSHKEQTSHIKIIPNKRLTEAPKKDSITTAIAHSNKDWMITTDADCLLPRYWLDAYDEFIQSYELNCVVGPVNYIYENSFLNRFQTLEFLSLQGVTIGGFGLNKPIMCNGANLAYRKSVFLKLDGFKENAAVASGDDLFLLQDLLNHNKKKVKYLKSQKAMVLTKPMSRFKDILQQRIRWASKTGKLKGWPIKLVGVIVFLANLSMVCMVPLVLLQILTIKTAVLLFVLKWCIDFLLLFKVCRWYNTENLLFSFIGSSFMYPFFNVYCALLSLYKPYQWKGRQFKY